MCYNWRWGVAESKTHSRDNMASVVVIDGGMSLLLAIITGAVSESVCPVARLLLTPFRYTVVPPPMCAHEVLLPSPVLQVTFAPPPRCNDFVALLASGQLAVFSGPKVKEVQGDSPSGRGPCAAPQLLGIARYGVTPPPGAHL